MVEFPQREREREREKERERDMEGERKKGERVKRIEEKSERIC